MKQWAHSIAIDTSMFLEEELIEAVKELNFNPGEGITRLSSISYGLSVMSSQGHTSAETKHIRKCKEALSAMENACFLDEFLCVSKEATRVLADNF